MTPCRHASNEAYGELQRLKSINLPIIYYNSRITGYKLVRQYSVPAETIRHIWLRSRLSTNSCLLPGVGLLSSKKWVPVETVRLIVLPAESLGRKQFHADRFGRKPFIMCNSLESKYKIGTVSAKPKLTDSGQYPVRDDGNTINEMEQTEVNCDVSDPDVCMQQK